MSLLLVMASPGADVEVMAIEGKHVRGLAAATVFTNDHLVAGYFSENAVGHGATQFSKPFVWHSGTVHTLPTGDGEYARVFAGNDQVLIGEASAGTAQRAPAKWTPDPKLGWAKAKLEMLGKSGYAIAITEEGVIWIEDDERIYSIKNGKVGETIHAPQFDIVGIDRWGRIWGNRYARTAPGDIRLDRRAVFIENGKFVELSLEIELFDVNLSATAVGQYSESPKKGPIILENGRLLEPNLPPESWLIDVNEKGVVLGSYGRAKKGGWEISRFIYSDAVESKLQFDGIADVRVEMINDRGSLLYSVVIKKGNKLVLRKAP